MIQDFSSSVFVGKQAVRGRSVPVRSTSTVRGNNTMAKRIIAKALAGALLLSLSALLTSALLIRSEHRELTAQNTTKIELMKEQQGLYSQRTGMLDQETLTRTAGKLGLYTPEDRQLRHL